jgi:outer membrane immunogenic protein
MSTRITSGTTMMHRALPTLFALGAATGAFAGELPSNVAPVRPVPVWEQTTPTPKYFTWTGGYVGLQVGGAWQRLGDAANAPLLPPIAGTPGLPGYSDTTNTASGLFAGGHIGFNYQFGDFLVAGVEGDVEGASVHNYAFAYGAGFGPYSVETYNNLRASARARLGYALGHWLLYGTAGGAWANFSTGHSFVVGANSDNSNYTPLGWTLGAGVEYAFMGNLSARLEYRYADYGTSTIYSATPGLAYGERATEHSLRAGISYRFWAPAPPMSGISAKY